MNLLQVFEDSDDVDVFAAGDVIFNQGDQGNFMYVLLDGEVDIFVDGEKVNSLGAGEVLGEMALVGDLVRTASLKAATDCRLAAVDEKRFLYMVQQTPFFSLYIMRVLADRLKHAHQGV